MSTSRRAKGFFRAGLQVAAIGAVAFTARASLADHYRVPSGSMEPNVHVGDHIVVSKASYGIRLPLTEHYLLHFRAPSRGEVVVIEPPDAESRHASEPEVVGAVLLKRIVAVAGDLVEVRNGHVLIDGKPAPEHTLSLAWGGGPDLAPTLVPEGKVLLLGDNRGNSRDGRVFGFVDRDHVLGRAFAVVGRDGKIAYEPL